MAQPSIAPFLPALQLDLFSLLQGNGQSQQRGARPDAAALQLHVVPSSAAKSAVQAVGAHQWRSLAEPPAAGQEACLPAGIPLGPCLPALSRGGSDLAVIEQLRRELKAAFSERMPSSLAPSGPPRAPRALTHSTSALHPGTAQQMLGSQALTLVQRAALPPRRAAVAGTVEHSLSNGLPMGLPTGQSEAARPLPPPQPALPPLAFSCEFEGGNFACARQVSQGHEYDIMLSEDTLAPRHRLWFHFTMAGGVAGQKVVLHIINFSKARALYRHGMTPLVRSTGRPAWSRLPPSCCFYHRSPKCKAAYVLSVLFTIDRTGDAYQFAYTYPYTYTQLQRFLAGAQRQRLPYCERGLLTRSVQGRRLDVLTIAEEVGGEGAWGAGCRRPAVVISARVHPGETPASYMAQGFLAYLLASRPEAVLLRRVATWVVVPMLNPDGVFLGNYRTDAGGLDMNRLWNSADAQMEPALSSLLALLQRYAADPHHRLDLFIDLHGHSASRSHFLFCNPPPEGAPLSPEASERMSRLPRLLDSCCPGFMLSTCRWDKDARKLGCARRVVGGLFPETLSFTFEVSMFTSGVAPKSGPGADKAASQPGGQDPAPAHIDHENTPPGYLDLGHHLAQALLAFYQLDCLPAGLPAS